MKKYFIIIGLLLISCISFSQIAPYKYLIQFTDKNNSPYSINNPSEYLSPKAIERRNKQGISIKENDLPVNPAYVDSVSSTGVIILNKSKWFNSVTIQTDDSLALVKINSFPFVKKITKSIIIKSKVFKIPEKTQGMFLKPFFANETVSDKVSETISKTLGNNYYNYGFAYNQIHMIYGDSLHNEGYRGRGVTIAILDAGFINADTLPVFDSLWLNNQILGTYDFVNKDSSVFKWHTHGTMVLSTMGGNLPGKIIGTAPKANYWLLRSEDASSEYLIEEYNWVSAAEFADSVGADIINSSLGYTVFWDSTQNHSYSNMDGNTTPVTVGADIAVSKGIIVVNSAGNEGNNSWRYICAPADGDSVLAVGAVDSAGNYASFSSIGPSYDGRIKPNIAAQGKGATVASAYGDIWTNANGTSFSSPIIAGMTACLWQAHTNLSNMQIINAIEKSSSKFSNPDSLLGFGIPNFALANQYLSGINEPVSYKNILFSVYPNPFNDDLTIVFHSNKKQNLKIELFNMNGQRVFYKDNIIVKNGYNSFLINNTDNLLRGLYFLKLSSPYCYYYKKIIKN